MAQRFRKLGGYGIILCLGLVQPVLAGGIAFPPAGCTFGHWPETGWQVAPTPPVAAGKRLLRASHSPTLGVAVEAWLEPPAGSEDEGFQKEMGLALAKRGWQLDRAIDATVGTLPAHRARAHRRVGRELFLLDEYWIEAAGKRYVLRITSRGARGLQHPEVRRWLTSFQLSG